MMIAVENSFFAFAHEVRVRITGYIVEQSHMISGAECDGSPISRANAKRSEGGHPFSISSLSCYLVRNTDQPAGLKFCPAHGDSAISYGPAKLCIQEHALMTDLNMSASSCFEHVASEGVRTTVGDFYQG